MVNTLSKKGLSSVIVAAVTPAACVAINRVDQGEFRYTVNNGDQRTLMVLANHRINFPITNACFLFNNGWPLINTDMVFDLTTLILRTIALAFRFFTCITSNIGSSSIPTFNTKPYKISNVNTLSFRFSWARREQFI
jgi:hypothetical protein